MCWAFYISVNVLVGLNEHCTECVLLKSFSWDESEIPFSNGLLDDLEPTRSMELVEDRNTAWKVKVNSLTFVSVNPLSFFKVLLQNLFRIYSSRS